MDDCSTLDEDPELVKRMQARHGEAVKEEAKQARKEFLTKLDATKKSYSAAGLGERKSSKGSLFQPRTHRAASDATGYSRNSAPARSGRSNTVFGTSVVRS